GRSLPVGALPSRPPLAPSGGGGGRPRAGMTPALTSSSLYFVIASRISVLGISPASDSGLPGTRTMKRIGTSCGDSVFLPPRRTRAGEIDITRHVYRRAPPKDGPARSKRVAAAI